MAGSNIMAGFLLIIVIFAVVYADNHEKEFQLVFEDKFDQLDLNKWDQEISLSGGGHMYNEFQGYTPDKKNTYVRDGKLFIKPTLTQCNIDPQSKVPFGDVFLHSGKWNVTDMYGGCTQPMNNGCARDAEKHGMLPPVMSGRLTSRLAFKYGRFEIEAKLPSGDWLWPGVQMVPETPMYGAWPRSGEIDIVELRGNKALTVDSSNGSVIGNQKAEYGLHWGETKDLNKLTRGYKMNVNDSFSDEFHSYVMHWNSEKISFEIDGKVVGEFPDPASLVNKTWGGFWKFGVDSGDLDNSTNSWENATGLLAPFDQKFRMVLNVAVGGRNGFFPDDVTNGDSGDKPWTNSMDNATAMFWSRRTDWFRSWDGENSAMQVKSIRVYQLPEPTTTTSTTTTTQKTTNKAPSTGGNFMRILSIFCIIISLELVNQEFN